MSKPPNATPLPVSASPSWRPEFSGADTQAAASIADGGALPVDLYFGYYARPRPGHSMTAHINRLWEDEVWTLADSGNVTAQFAGNPVRAPAERFAGSPVRA